MRFDPGHSLLAVAAAVGLALPPAPLSARMIVAMPLCNGGTVDLDLGKRGPENPPGACHAMCAVRRDDDSGQRAPRK